jgi:iron complex transport system ATP-binding protein
MITISYAKPWIAAALVFIILTAGLLRYPGSLQFLKRPALWIQLSIIVVLTALFKNGFEQIYLWEGIAPGVKMSMRALLVLGCFAIISVEMKNPVLKNLLYNKGFQNLYQSVELAFSALPVIMSEFYDRTHSVKKFRKLTHTMLNRSRTMLDTFRKAEQNRMPVFIVTGGINQGKTSFARQIAEILRNRGIIIRGLFTLGNTNNSSRSAYYIKDISTGSEAELCSTTPDSNRLAYGRFYFNEKTILYGREILTSSIDNSPGLVVIDEIGPLEINDEGWAPAIERLVVCNASPQLWVVRERLVKPIMRKWNVGDIIVININEDSPEEAALLILERERGITRGYKIVDEGEAGKLNNIASC